MIQMMPLQIHSYTQFNKKDKNLIMQHVLLYLQVNKVSTFLAKNSLNYLAAKPLFCIDGMKKTLLPSSIKFQASKFNLLGFDFEKNHIEN